MPNNLTQNTVFQNPKLKVLMKINAEKFVKVNCVIHLWQVPPENPKKIRTESQTEKSDHKGPISNKKLEPEENDLAAEDEYGYEEDAGGMYGNDMYGEGYDYDDDYGDNGYGYDEWDFPLSLLPLSSWEGAEKKWESEWAKIGSKLSYSPIMICHHLLRCGLIPFWQSFTQEMVSVFEMWYMATKNIGNSLSSSFLLMSLFSSFLLCILLWGHWGYTTELLWILLAGSGSNIKNFVPDSVSLCTMLVSPHESSRWHPQLPNLVWGFVIIS